MTIKVELVQLSILFSWNSPLAVVYFCFCGITLFLRLFRYRYKNKAPFNFFDRCIFSFYFAVVTIHLIFILWINIESFYFYKPLSELGLSIEKILTIAIPILLIGSIVSSRFQLYIGLEGRGAFQIHNVHDPKWVKFLLNILSLNFVSGFLWYPIEFFILSKSFAAPFQPNEGDFSRIFTGLLLLFSFWYLKSIFLIFVGKDDSSLGKIKLSLLLKPGRF